MILNWKEFKIDLKSFYDFISNNIPNSDGIVANEDNFVIAEKVPFTSDDITLIMDYYNSLTESGESDKLLYPNKVLNAYNKCKISIISKNFDELTSIERKILVNSPLTESEEIELVNTYI